MGNVDSNVGNGSMESSNITQKAGYGQHASPTETRNVPGKPPLFWAQWAQFFIRVAYNGNLCELRFFAQ